MKLLPLKEVSQKHVALVGTKAASLGELRQLGIAVPPAFVIPSSMYKEFLVESGSKDRIFQLLKHIENKKIEQVAERIKNIIVQYPLPEKMRAAIYESYVEMGFREVCVRASSVDGKGQCTVMHVKGEEALMQAVKQCWASLYDAEHLRMKERKPRNDAMAVLVQEMIYAERGGSIEIDKDRIKLQLVHGMSSVIDEGIVHAEVIVHPKDLTIKQAKAQPQEYTLEKHFKEQKLVKKETKLKAPFTEREMHNLAQLGKSIYQHYGLPQIADVLVNDKVWVVNCRRTKLPTN